MNIFDNLYFHDKVSVKKLREIIVEIFTENSNDSKPKKRNKISKAIIRENNIERNNRNKYFNNINKRLIKAHFRNNRYFRRIYDSRRCCD